MNVFRSILNGQFLPKQKSGPKYLHTEDIAVYQAYHF